MRRIRSFSVVMLMAVAGCHSSKPFIALGPPAATNAADSNVSTSKLGTVSSVPGVLPPPKPFIAIARPAQASAAKPSTLLLEHASPDSPVPLSEYGKQPVYSLRVFNLRRDLTAKDLQRIMGPPVQIADCGDPWLVYRLSGNRELWMHFVGPSPEVLDAADVVGGAEDGYTRERVFSADDSHE
jgi:hypothetical protein